jgi:hypothetical protein
VRRIPQRPSGRIGEVDRGMGKSRRGKLRTQYCVTLVRPRGQDLLSNSIRGEVFERTVM